jgi:flagellar hook-associated protein 2
MTPIYGYSALLSSYGIDAALASSLFGTGSTTSSAGSTATTTADAYQTDISAYGQLLSSLSNFQYALVQLTPPYNNNTLSASSSNSSVANATATSGARSASYNLNVNTLAQSETVESGSFSDPGSTIIGSGTLNIRTGTYQSGSNTFTSDGSSTVHVAVNNGTLSSIATAINASGAGVVASVQQDSNGYHLAISSSKTGALNNFQILVNDSDGNNTDLSGLSQLAYDPTAGSGQGQNLNVVQAGQNAAYSVNGVGTSNSSNDGVSLASDVSANLLQSGSTTISVGVDFNQLSSAAQSLESAFNTLQAGINGLTGQGGVLYGDSIATTLTNLLNLQATTNLNNGSSSLTTLSQIGLQFQPPQVTGQGGTLTLSPSILQFAFNTDSSGAANLVSLSAEGFNTLSYGYTAPGYGTLPQTMTQLQSLDQDQQLRSVASSQNENITFNLQDYLQQEAKGTFGQRTPLSAQQIGALSAYATILSLGEPYAVQALLVGNIGLSNMMSGREGGVSTFA